MLGPFDYHAGFAVLLCRICRYACTLDQVYEHLRTKHLTSISRTQRTAIYTQAAQCPGLHTHQALFQGILFPPQPIEPRTCFLLLFRIRLLLI